jgi:chloramphenicol O-acetyltransferase
MTLDDLQELAQKVGMVKTPQGTFKPLWMASDDQLMAFAQAVIRDVKQSASEFVVQAIKKAVDYEREQCAILAEIDNMTPQDIRRAIRGRAHD